MNQDYALARWREDTARLDPGFYSAKRALGRIFVWLSVGGNTGWYAPEIKGGAMVGLRALGYPQPYDGERTEDSVALNFAFRLVSPKQRQKIERIVQRVELESSCAAS